MKATGKHVSLAAAEEDADKVLWWKHWDPKPGEPQVNNFNQLI